MDAKCNVKFLTHSLTHSLSVGLEFATQITPTVVLTFSSYWLLLWVPDLQVEGPELDLLQGLHDDVYQEALEWYQGIDEHIRERINAQYGPMPEKEDTIQVREPAWPYCFY